MTIVALDSYLGACRLSLRTWTSDDAYPLDGGAVTFEGNDGLYVAIADHAQFINRRLFGLPDLRDLSPAGSVVAVPYEADPEGSPIEAVGLTWEIVQKGIYPGTKASGLPGVISPMYLAERALGDWVPCEGQTLARADHPELFDAAGIEGDEVVVPDLRDAVVVGAGGSPPAGLATSSDRYARPITAEVSFWLCVRGPSASDLAGYNSLSIGDLVMYLTDAPPLDGLVPCDGREIPVDGDVAGSLELYSVAGAWTTDTSTVLPDLRGRLPLSAGRTKVGSTTTFETVSGADQVPVVGVHTFVAMFGRYPVKG